MSEGSSRTEHLPYELTAEQFAREQIDRLYSKYGHDPHVLAAALSIELPEIIHNSIEFGLAIGDNLGDIGPVDLLEAFSAGVNYRNQGEE